MTHTFLVELTDEVKGYEDSVDYLERVYGAEEFDLAEHDKQIRADAIKPIQKFIDDYDGAIIISENMGVINGQQLINELKEIVERLKGAEKQKKTCFDCKYHFMSDFYLECNKHERINCDEICIDYELKE